jgi:hypothetical protein
MTFVSWLSVAIALDRRFQGAIDRSRGHARFFGAAGSAERPGNHLEDLVSKAVSSANR